MTKEIPGTLLLDPKVIADPYPFYRQLHSHAPVWQVPGTEVFIVSSYSLLVEAASRVEDFSSNMPSLLYRDENGLPVRLSFGDAGLQALATADPPLHTLHRSTVFPNFVAKRMTLLEPEVVEIATDCVERALDKGNVDFMTEIGNIVPITIISRLIGFRNSDLDRLLRSAFDSTEMVGAALSRERLIELITRSNELGAWIGDQLELAAKEPGEDILTSIGNGIENGVFSVGVGIVILQTLLAAGGESTTSLLGSAVRLLADHQDLQQRLRQQPELIPNFVEEALRMESPFRHHMRWVPRDTRLGDVDIPAGASLLLMWGAANRDSTVFENPDEIVLGRPRRHVAFGRDIHFCIGAPLARLEARVVLGVLLAHTSSVTLDPDQPPRWVYSLMVRRYERLPVQFAPR
ncbi:MAG: cytochrome P450 [Candidatus Binataceae bacterium]